MSVCNRILVKKVYVKTIQHTTSERERERGVKVKQKNETD